MAYKLPKDLKYKEKVIGNLTWRQTIYIGTGTTLALTTLLINTFTPIKLLLATTILTITLVFSFTDIESSLKDRIIYHTSVKEAGYLDEEAKNFLEIQKLERNGVAKRNDGTRIAFLEVEPVNLKIKTDQEKQEIITQYQKFLDSIQFPLHINIKTIDTLQEIETFFDQKQEKVQEQVHETGSKKLQDQFKDYRDYWKNYVEENGVKTRKYYIIIPSNHRDKEKAHKQLNRRTELVKEKLPRQIPAKRLSKTELTRMLASYFGNLVQHQNQYYSPFTLTNRED